MKGDGKGLATIHAAKNEDILLATQNQDSLLAFSKKSIPGKSTLKWINLNPDDFSADIVFKDNRKSRVEFYYGSTFLSQSSRRLPIDKNVVKVTITDFKGNKREVIK